MKIRVNLEIKKLQRFCKLSPEYCEIITRNGVSVLCSENGIRFNLALLDVLDGKLNDGNIRISTDLLNNLKTERVVDVIEDDSSISLCFYDAKVSHLYTTSVPKQIGVIDISDKLSLIENVQNYNSYEINRIKPIVDLLSILNEDILCLNKLAYGLYMRSYIFEKCSMPNFCVAAKDLKLLMSCVSKIYFIDKFIYGVTVEQVHVFLHKSRVPDLCDIEFIMNSKYNNVVKIDSKNIRTAQRKLKTTDKSEIVLNLESKSVDVFTETYKSNISIDILDVKGKKLEVDNDTILKAMTGEADLSVDINSVVNPYGLPKLLIPRWVLRYGFSSDNCEIFINKKFIIVKSLGVKILFSRCNYETQK